MYTITFYSFKGGVGRTFALANVGADLARRGRRVLLVDFDLEAPGLDTFERLRPPPDHPGVVEYVAEYLRTKQIPEVRRFVYQVGAIGEKDGQLWVMPAGRRDVKYQAGLVGIDWKRLYRDGKGFEFFEHTKKQWEEAFSPDYVLIDSRTGHTDVEGICTRQLADAVVVLFFPNEQNLVGLRDVCRRIRGELTSGLKKNIRLHFVMSNVPDLDDEDEILHHRLEAFHKELGFDKPDTVIHRYESAMLFNQAIFVLDRPRSRLASEYRQLTEELIMANPADREGALHWLHQYAQSYLPTVSRDIGRQREKDRRLGSEEVSISPAPSLVSPAKLKKLLNRLQGRGDALDKIIGNFLDDPDILLEGAECRILEDDYASAEKLLDRVLQVKPKCAQAFFERALCKSRTGKQGAADDLLRYLAVPGVAQGGTLRALRQLQMSAPERLVDALNQPAVQALDNAYELSEISELLIGAKHWKEAISLLEKQEETPYRLFDLAMAEWGARGVLSAERCRRVLELIEPDYEINVDLGTEVNLLMYALVLWGAGETEEALRAVDKASGPDQKSWRPSERRFSPWRYRHVPQDQFLEDCQQLRRMIQGEALRPAFLGEASPQPESASLPMT